ncbi:MAG: HPr(Ser) kinase/phosphatase [Ruminococcaceae bacterium]|nr:HPr(Ser) kinase/phosphatase [Oscillospiraceae bacterium]
MGDFKFSVSLGKIVDEFKLEPVCVSENYEKIKIVTNEINRPSLQIAGFFDYFYNDRIQIMGRVEFSYLEKLSSQERYVALERLFEKHIPCVIVSHNMEVPEEMIELAQKYTTPVLRTENTTSRFMSALIAFLNVELAPRITMHGVLVEVYGEGILLLGDSGVGKSEAAIELVKRGHRLVADDAVEVKRVSDISLLGSAPDVIRHFIELRGIGIVDVKMIFGIGAVKNVEKIDFVINLELWQDKKQYDRLGLTTEYMDILGIKIPSITVPVKPGRNLAVVIEVAAMNNRQKKMGYNAAEALNNKLMSQMGLEEDE